MPYSKALGLSKKWFTLCRFSIQSKSIIKCYKKSSIYFCWKYYEKTAKSYTSIADFVHRKNKDKFVWVNITSLKDNKNPYFYADYVGHSLKAAGGALCHTLKL